MDGAFLILSIIIFIILVFINIELYSCSSVIEQYRIIRTLYNRKLKLFRYSNLEGKVTINKYKLHKYIKRYTNIVLLRLLAMNLLYLLITRIGVNNRLAELMFIVVLSNLVYDNLISIKLSIKAICKFNSIKGGRLNEV